MAENMTFIVEKETYFDVFWKSIPIRLQTKTKSQKNA